MQRVATHVVFQQVAQVLGRDMQVSGPLQTRLGPHAIHLVFSDTLLVGGRGTRRNMDIIHSFPELQYSGLSPLTDSPSSDQSLYNVCHTVMDSLLVRLLCC